jgi:hypothetical protein
LLRTLPGLVSEVNFLYNHKTYQDVLKLPENDLTEQEIREKIVERLKNIFKIVERLKNIFNIE